MNSVISCYILLVPFSPSEDSWISPELYVHMMYLHCIPLIWGWSWPDPKYLTNLELLCWFSACFPLVHHQKLQFSWEKCSDLWMTGAKQSAYPYVLQKRPYKMVIYLLGFFSLMLILMVGLQKLQFLENPDAWYLQNPAVKCTTLSVSSDMLFFNKCIAEVGSTV